MMVLHTDALGRTFHAPVPPGRVVSLCPSQTVTLLELGVPVVGRTRYCIHPAGVVEAIPEVGGPKKVDYALIEQLRPDLIICEKEENTPEMVARLEQIAPVAVTDVRDLDSCLQMIHQLGAYTGRQVGARRVAGQVGAALAALPQAHLGSVAYLIWRKPWMGAGNDTFIQAVLCRLGFSNVLAPLPGRYPSFTLEELTRLNPSTVLLSSEPFPFARRHVEELQEALPDARILLVDGEAFSWYGSWLAHKMPYLGTLAQRLTTE
jgi:ABC-type Fe3+-hydroxamate transport system substrate-binding protein